MDRQLRIYRGRLEMSAFRPLWLCVSRRGRFVGHSRNVFSRHKKIYARRAGLRRTDMTVSWTRQTALGIVCRIAIVWTLAFGLGRCDADLIRLKNGGEIRGSILDTATTMPKSQIAIQTLTGARVVVDVEDVEFVTRRPPVVEEYETRCKTAPLTVEAQWALAEWCREQGLQDQRSIHLERILDLDPTHTQAHYGLGHTEQDGRWVSREERDAAMRAQGYVRYKGRYITTQEMELLEKSRTEFEAERAWFAKVRVWRGWLLGQDADRQARGLEEFREIQDPDAVPALTRFLANDKNVQIRHVYIRILARIPGAKPVRPLVAASLNDSKGEIRSAALAAIGAERGSLAVPHYIRALRSELNVAVRRAAAALEQLGDAQVVPILIDALVTTHTYEVTMAGSDVPTYSFRTDGTFESPGAKSLPAEIEVLMRTGQLPYGAIVQKPLLPGDGMVRRTVTVRHTHRNPETLAALKKLTGKDLGYDERTWRLWWASDKTVGPALDE